MQGQGIGAALMRHALERVDAERLPAYLESSNSRNISLYRRFGFELVGQFRSEARRRFIQWCVNRSSVQGPNEQGKKLL